MKTFTQIYRELITSKLKNPTRKAIWKFVKLILQLIYWIWKFLRFIEDIFDEEGSNENE